MKSSELRIGNYLQDSITKTTLEVIQLNNTGIDTYVVDRSKYPLKEGWQLEPIPLTEEWLLKFGFERKIKSWYELKYLSNEHNKEMKSWVSVLINIGNWSCVICDEYPDEMGANTKTKIEYVHQLQNLYFALTGEELTLKP